MHELKDIVEDPKYPNEPLDMDDGVAEEVAALRVMLDGLGLGEAPLLETLTSIRDILRSAWDVREALIQRALAVRYPLRQIGASAGLSHPQIIARREGTVSAARVRLS